MFVGVVVILVIKDFEVFWYFMVLGHIIKIKRSLTDLSRTRDVRMCCQVTPNIYQCPWLCLYRPNLNI